MTGRETLRFFAKLRHGVDWDYTIALADRLGTNLDKRVGEVADDGRTVFLSSHTLSEVERVADRVGIIRRGQLIAVEEVSALRRKRMRRIEIDIDGTIREQELAVLPGVRDLVIHPDRIEMNFDGDMPQLLAAVTSKVALRDIHTEEA